MLPNKTRRARPFVTTFTRIDSAKIPINVAYFIMFAAIKNLGVKLGENWLIIVYARFLTVDAMVEFLITLKLGVLSMRVKTRYFYF